MRISGTETLYQNNTLMYILCVKLNSVELYVCIRTIITKGFGADAEDSTADTYRYYSVMREQTWRAILTMQFVKPAASLAEKHPILAARPAT